MPRRTISVDDDRHDDAVQVAEADGEADADGYYMPTAAGFGSLIPTVLNLPLVGEVS